MIKRVDHAGIAVKGLMATLKFYEDMLGLKNGEGIQHIVFRVDNLEQRLAELKEKGVQLIDEKPRRGAGGANIAFLHPKSTSGVLIELCERD
jgi:catechol 2,3-dioxygenase-like lactoylglutathione lyase family enzyme